MTKFPPNPADKTIFEASSGEFFQYDKSKNTWTKLQGYGILFDEASSLSDGLMPNTDYQKINSLLLPPPHTSLTSPSCGHFFDTGVFGIRSNNEDLLIDTSLTLVSKDSEGNPVETQQVWKIHENTYGINFRINLPQLVDNLTAKGKLTYHKTVGPQGKKGETGKDGINKLETGPQGEPGDDGKNASFLGALIQEGTNTVSAAPEGNRAVVDVYTQSQADGNFLIVTRANVGNVEECPALVMPKNLKSKWILAADERPAYRRVLETCNPKCQSSPGSTGCSNMGKNKVVIEQVVQNFCSTSLYFIDMTSVEDDIRAKYIELLDNMQEAKKAVVEQWLNVMIGVYNDQKNAMCCAIENCESKQENQKNRQYLEQMRMAGANAHVSTVISCDTGDRQFKTFSTTDNRDCPVTPPTSREFSRDLQPYVARIEIDCSNNSPTEAQAVTVELEAGAYQIEAASCACYSSEIVSESDYLKALSDPASINSKLLGKAKDQKPYTGVFTIVYQTPEGPKKVIAPNFGSYKTSDEAIKAYTGNNIIINHSGGPLKAFFAGGSFRTKEFGNSGKMQLFVRKQTSAALMRSPHRDCASPLLELDIDCGLNFEADNAVDADLDAGSYVVEVDDCCCQVATPAKNGISSGYAGMISLEFVDENGDSKIMSNPNVGVFRDQIAAAQKYMGSSFGFTHKGGKIRVWSSIQGISGGVLRVAIRHKDCFENLHMPSIGPGFGPSIEKRETKRRQVSAEFTTCSMTLSQLMFYEGGWMSRACCGVLVEAGGVKWLVVKRSIGADTTCGGGETEDSDCIQKSAPFGFHPAIAFQTMDGKTFFGKPSSGMQTLYRDHELERMIIEKIEKNEVLERVGDPKANISAILFPFEGANG